MQTKTTRLFLIFSSLTALLITSGAKAQSLSAVSVHSSFTFLIDGQDSGIDEQTFYTCDSVQQATLDLLGKLGAHVTSVNCSGGDGQQPVLNPFVSVELDSIRLPSTQMQGPPVAAKWVSVALNGTDGCDLTRQILTGVSDHLELKMATPFTCGESNDGYRYKLEVLVPR